MYIWLRLKAGSGKSTIVKFIIAALGLAPEEVAYVAFTGKAATVLAQKGCQNATTAHKLLYRAKQLNTGKYIFEPVKSLKPVQNAGVYISYIILFLIIITFTNNMIFPLLLLHI